MVGIARTTVSICTSTQSVSQRLATVINRIAATAAELRRDYGVRAVAVVPNVTGGLAPQAEGTPPEPAGYLLFVGRLRHYKGLHHLLEAMLQIDVPLVIVGDGAQEAALKSQATRLGLHGKVTFAGAAAGPIEIVAPRVTIASGARLVAGASIYTIGEPVIEPGAVIDGKIAVHPIHDARGFAPPAPGAFLGDLMLALGLAASGLVAGLLWLFAGRGSVERTIDNLVEHAGRSAVNGILTVVGIPALIALMVLTVIGIPFAAVLALAVPLLLLLAVAGAGYGIGEFLFNRLGEPRSPGARVLMLFAGLLVLGLVSLIPWAGPALVGAAVVVGLGALIAALRTQLG